MSRAVFNRFPALMLALVFLAVLAAALPAAAHHTFVTKYDNSKKTKLSGTITSVSYQNPHIFFTLEAAGASWTVETESISVAQSNGLTAAKLVEGAQVTITGWPSREKSAEIGLASISFAKGGTITMRKTAR